MNIKDKSSSEHQEQVELDHHHLHTHSAHSSDEHHNHQDHSHKEHSEESSSACCCSSSHSPILSAEQIKQESQKIKSAKYRSQFYIQNMDCPTEEALIRKKLSTNPNAEALEFNLIKRILTVYHQHSEVDTIICDLNAIDMRPELIPQNGQLPLKQGKDYKLLKLGIAGGLALLSEVLEFITPHNIVVLILALLAIALSGLSTYKKGWIALINRNINMNVLMSIAVTGALIIGQWAEAAMVMALFNLSEWIEAKSLDRARDAIGNLLRLVPETVLVLRNSDEWVETKVDDIQLDEILKVSPGERIPLDGVISKGMTTINQASITGESLPVERGVGETVFAGTLNEVGQFEYRVTTLATETTLAKIIHTVEEAQSKKAPTQKFVDKFAKVYTPVAFLIALLVAILPPLFSSATWLSSIYNGLVLLVIACPCALVISTPITIVSGLVAATKRGIIIKGGTYLEQGRKLTMLALDKTGTLTVGRPALTDSYFIETTENHKLGNIAYSLTKQSDHPVSIAIANQLQKEYNEQQLHNFTAILGSGTQAEIDGQTWYLTNIRFVRNKLEDIPASVSALVEKFEKEGKSIVLLFNEYDGIQAIFAVADTVKESSQRALIKLREMGVKSVMLTGDNHFTAEAIGQEVGIDDVKAELLPIDKSTAIIEMKKEGFVGMVGDGINDAPALANADIGFAMGKIGTDTAIETADVALMEDDLEKIPDFIELSKSTHQILVQNISFAIGVKILFFGLALFGLADMWMAIFADVGTSLLVIANGLRMMRK